MLAVLWSTPHTLAHACDHLGSVELSHYHDFGRSVDAPHFGTRFRVITGAHLINDSASCHSTCSRPRPSRQTSTGNRADWPRIQKLFHLTVPGQEASTFYIPCGCGDTRSRWCASVLGGGSHNNQAGRTKIKLSSRVDPRFSRTVDTLILPSLTSYQSSVETVGGDWTHLFGVHMADSYEAFQTPIELLPGADMFAEILHKKIRRGPVHEHNRPSSDGFSLVLSPTDHQ